MPLFLIAFISIAILILAYIFYGRFLAKWFALDKNFKTPACEINDGVDYVPAKPSLLLGQHFSAIAAAGPIVGPILAGLWFGWIPAILWIIIGSIFIGAVHDFSSLVGSVRHRANSIAEIVRIYVGEKAFKFFLIFIWFSLVYVIIVFADLTSSSFIEPNFGAGVASSSFFYLIIAFLMGICIYKLKMPLWLATLIFVPVVGFNIWYGQKIPFVITSANAKLIWNLIILVYCFIASIVPMWLLLQPRGYLGGIFLYVALFIGIFGIVLGGVKTQYPAFLGFTNSGKSIFPILFITIACGACSGFHSIVSTGTTSKQIKKETDCLPIGYGSMLLEALVAIIALGTLMMLIKGDPLLSSTPDRIFANGLSSFTGKFGINKNFAFSFALLAFATFIYDTLDVSTRLGRYIFQELTGLKGIKGSIIATLITLFIPFIYFFIIPVLTKGTLSSWQAIWPIFGASNQLLAGLTLLGVSSWLISKGKNPFITLIPMIFMFIFTIWTLVLNIIPLFTSSGFDIKLINGILAMIILSIAIIIISESIKMVAVLRSREPQGRNTPFKMRNK